MAQILPTTRNLVSLIGIRGFHCVVKVSFDEETLATSHRH